jgi:hypothetical protein
MTYISRSPFGSEVRCEPGETTNPTGVCERHPHHYWCSTCLGFYGVPHDGMHEGRNAHPNTPSARDCACRICTNWRAQIAARQDRRCPDGGSCHHSCEGQCFRVRNCGPLSGVYRGDKWPTGLEEQG